MCGCTDHTRINVAANNPTTQPTSRRARPKESMSATSADIFLSCPLSSGVEEFHVWTTFGVSGTVVAAFFPISSSWPASSDDLFENLAVSWKTSDSTIFSSSLHS